VVVRAGSAATEAGTGTVSLLNGREDAQVLVHGSGAVSLATTGTGGTSVVFTARQALYGESAAGVYLSANGAASPVSLGAGSHLYATGAGLSLVSSDDSKALMLRGAGLLSMTAGAHSVVMEGRGVLIRDTGWSNPVSIFAGSQLLQTANGILLSSSGGATGSLVVNAAAQVSITAGSSSLVAVTAGIGDASSDGGGANGSGIIASSSAAAAVRAAAALRAFHAKHLRGVVADLAVGEAREDGGVRDFRPPGLLAVHLVVQADADDLVGFRDHRQPLDRRKRDPRGVRRRAAGVVERLVCDRRAQIRELAQHGADIVHHAVADDAPAADPGMAKAGKLHRWSLRSLGERRARR
jgi:hypothetical protein